MNNAVAPSILLLGSPLLRLGDRPMQINRRKSRALLFYLATSPVAVRREQLLDLLWSEHERQGARQVLRSTLHGLRQALGNALLTDDETVGLVAESDVDVRRFEAQLAATDRSDSVLIDALALYRGDFLDGFELPDAPAFEGWALARRERYRTLAIRGFAALARRHEASHNICAALDALSRALDLDPLQEDLQRACMRLHYLSGDRAGAIRRFEQLRRLLDDEMGVPPMAETQALYDAIITDTVIEIEDSRLKIEDSRSKIEDSRLKIEDSKANSADAPITLQQSPFTNPTQKGSTASGQTTQPMKSSPSSIFNLQPSTQTGTSPSSIFNLQSAIQKGSTASGQSMIQTGTSPSSIFNLQSAIPNVPFIGRETDLAALRTLATPGRLVLIEGEPGVGKTRLAQEFLRQNETLVLVGTARELEQTLPYQPLIEALRNLTAHSEWPALRAKLDLPAVWAAEAARLLPELAGPDQPPSLVQAAESRLWEGISQLLLAVARQRKVALLLDDLQWADDATLALLGYLVRRTAHAAVLLLATARPALTRTSLLSVVQTLTREERFGRLVLSRLSPEATFVLARQLSPNYGAALADWLQRNAEGLPYILTELVRDAYERGVLRSDGLINLSALSQTPRVPRTVYGLIQMRLASLSEAARRVLDAGVAAGREFEYEVVARAAALSEQAALDALDELRATGLLHPTSARSFAFDHSLTLEVAYHEVGEARHRLLHRRIAEALEQVHRDQLDEIAGLLAWHFAEGDAPERAAPYALRAGRRAAAVAAWREAAAFFRQALVASNETQRSETLMALGKALLRAGELAQAAEVLREALALAQGRGASNDDLDAAQLALAQSLLPQSRYAEVIALAHSVLERGSPLHAADAETIWGTALSVEGLALDEASAHLRQAELLARQASQPNAERIAQIRFELGSIAAQQGDLAGAVALYTETLELARQHGAPLDFWQTLALNNLAYHQHLLGNPQAAALAAEGLRLAESAGIVGLQPYLYSTIGEIAMDAGDLDPAETHFRHGLAQAEQLAMPERIAGLSANLGRLALRRGQAALAVHYLSTGLARADILGARHLAAQIRLWLAPLLPPDAARAYLAEARAIAESGGRTRLVAEIAALQKSFS